MSSTESQPPQTPQPPAERRQRPSPRYEAPQVENLLRKVVDLIEAARPMPLSASSMINKEEVLELLNETLSRLPDELRAARWLLKEREEFLNRVRREGEDILDQARARAERMVQRTEVVKAADQRARRIVDEAEEQARRMRLETEDYCDQKLGSFEIILEKTLQAVVSGRAKLQGNPLQAIAPENVEAEDAAEAQRAAFFDQDDH